MHFKSALSLYKDITYNLSTLSQSNNNYNGVYEISLFRTAPNVKILPFSRQEFSTEEIHLGLFESMTEDKKLVITMYSLHTFKQVNQPS